MSILITGGTGKLGKELAGVFPSALTPDRNELDITDRKSVFDYVKSKRPDTIIHTAAFTDVARSESEPEIAWKTNVTGTENLVDACVAHAHGARFVYISTACVFDGVKGMFTESDLPHPKNFYSLTKLLGEFVVKKMPAHIIVRTNFVAKEPWPYQRAFTDRYGTYLFAEDVARGIKDIVDEKLTGIVHVTGDRKMSMFELAKMTTPDVKPMTLNDYTGPALTVDMSLDTERWRKYKISKP